MILIVNTIWLCIFASLSKAEFCNEDTHLSELPGGIIREIFYYLTSGTISRFSKCPEKPKPIILRHKVRFLLYNRSNKNEPLILKRNNVEQLLDVSKPIKVLVPGWTCNVSNDRMPLLKDSYLQRYDCNVIGIDWSKLSIDYYSESFCNAFKVGIFVGNFLCFLANKLNVDLSKLHVLGHSMGGHLAGYIGKQTQLKCGTTIGRITGLDPAGPLYHLLPPSERLYKTDAAFVDVIHSNMGFLGYYGSLGTVDFYPNCGTMQKGCAGINLLRYTFCNHFRSADYMAESITTNTFTAYSCLTCPGLPLVGPCFSHPIFGSTTLMGEDSPPNPPHRSYVYTTNAQIPFSKG